MVRDVVLTKMESTHSHMMSLHDLQFLVLSSAHWFILGIAPFLAANSCGLNLDYQLNLDHYSYFFICPLFFLPDGDFIKNGLFKRIHTYTS